MQSRNPAVALHRETNKAPPPAPIPATELPAIYARKGLAVEQAPRSARRRKVRWVLFAVLPLALLAGGYWSVTGGRAMSTDDAYVEADKVGISTDVSGIVKDIDVAENQHVTAGQTLYRLDPRPFQIALESAQANLAQAKLTISSLKQDYRQASMTAFYLVATDHVWVDANPKETQLTHVR
jgi:membrane fusion protein, multidrug efflux system